MVWTTGILTTCLVLSADWVSAAPIKQAGLHLSLGLIFLLLAPAFAIVQTSITTRRWQGRVILNHRARFLHRSLMGSNLVVWLCSCVALLVVARWPALVRGTWELDSVPLLDEILLAAPMLASVWLSWIVIHDAEHALFGSQQANVCKKDRYRLSTQRFRTFAGLVLVPIALVLLTRDLSQYFFPEGMSVAIMVLVYATFSIFVMTVFPWVLSFTWRTSRVESGDLVDRLNAEKRLASLPAEKIFRWDTDCTVTNALVVGVFPGFRRVFLSDHLLDHFDDDEVVGIFKHELGHLVYHHLPMRVALFVLPLLCMFAVGFNGVDRISQYFGLQADGPAWLWLMLVLAYLFYVSKVVSRFICRAEVQADLFAISTPSGSVCHASADGYCRALLKLAAISPELYNRSSWLHPSIKMRLRVIEQVKATPQLLDRFNCSFHRDQCFAGVGLLVLVVMVGIVATAF